MGVGVFLFFYSFWVVIFAIWNFSVEADTEIVELKLGPSLQNRWPVGGATLCVPENEVPDKLRYLFDRATENPGLCGGHWIAGNLPGDEYILAFHAPPETDFVEPKPISVRLEKLEKSPMRAQFSRSSVKAVQAAIESLDGSDAIPLGLRFIVIWGDARESASESAGVILPFEGVSHIGRDVAPGVDRVLLSGTISVYSSTSSLGGRYLLEERKLMRGDRISLVSFRTSEVEEIPSSGFVSAGHGPGGGMQVVAFGTAEQLTVNRFAAASYDFEPGIFQQLLHDPVIAFGLAFLAFLGAVLSAAGKFLSPASEEEAEFPLQLEDVRKGGWHLPWSKGPH